MDNDINLDGGDDEILIDEDLPLKSETPEKADKGDAGDESDADGDDKLDAPESSEDDKDKGEKRRADFVPHAKFNEALQGRREAEERARQSEERARLLEQRTDILLQRLQPPQRQEDTPAEQSFKDRVAALQAEGKYVEAQDLIVEALDRQAAERRQFSEQQQSIQQRQYVERQILGAAQQDFVRAQAEDPSIAEAYNYIFAGAVQEKMALEGLSEADAAEQVKQNEIQLYYRTLQSGRRPSDAIKQLASLRGWRPQAAPAAEQAGDDGDITPDPEERRKAHISLSSMSGGQAPRRIGVKDLATMSEDEFARLSNQDLDKMMRTGAV